jgi:hypothetical protein
MCGTVRIAAVRAALPRGVQWLPLSMHISDPLAFGYVWSSSSYDAAPGDNEQIATRAKRATKCGLLFITSFCSSAQDFTDGCEPVVLGISEAWCVAASMAIAIVGWG